MKKIRTIIIMILLFSPIMIYAETITYDVCKSGCEYDNLATVIENIDSYYDGQYYNSNEIVINFKDNETYTYDNELVLRFMGKLTINGSNNTILSEKMSILTPNIEINDIVFNINNENGLFFMAVGINDYSESFYAKLTNVTVNNRYNGAPLTASITNFGYTMDIYNSNLNNFTSLGMTNIYNSKINTVLNAIQLNCYNCKFTKNINFISFTLDSNGNPIPPMSEDELNNYNVIEEDVSAAFGYDPDNLITKVYFDKETELKSGDKINLSEYLDYYANDKEIDYLIEDESIAKIENKELVGLKEGQTNVTITTDEGHIVYRIKLTVIKQTIAEKIDEMTVNIPITGTKIKVWVLVSIIMLFGVISVTIYLLIKNKKSK